MSVNNGTSTGSIPAGTPFTGAVTYDDAQTVTPAAFYGGTHSAYTFARMSLTIGATTLNWGPGWIDVYDNVTSTGGGYPIGDSFYINIKSPVAPGGTFNGAQFNWIFLGLVDPTGTAFTGSGIPANLNFASFQNPFIEFNYGTLGTPWGAGNTSMLQFLATLSKTSGTPTPPPTITTTSLPNGVYNMPYNAAISATAPNGDGLSLSVSGLPNALQFSGSNITGTPWVVGAYNVSITATDTVTKLSTTSVLPLNIADAGVTFTPTLPNGLVNSPYSATFAAAVGGTGSFTYTAAGLPPGLTLSGTTVSGTPTAAGNYSVALTATDTVGFAVTANVPISIGGSTICSGKNAVESAYVARNPGFVVVNGGLNLLDHLWTSNLNSSNTLFMGGLVNWYQTGLILDYTGTVDLSAGCILTNLTVKPAVTIDTASLPGGSTGVAYLAPVSVSWGVAPYTVTVSGLPAGLRYSASAISGTPSAAGMFTVTITAVDSVGATATKSLGLTITQSANYSIVDENKGKISSVGSGYLMAGTKKLTWNSSTVITVNTPSGAKHVIDSFVQPGMKVQWKGMRDPATNTVLTSQLEVN
jgi:hypothetical protein